MKKIIFLLAITFSSLGAFASDENIDQKILQAFNAEFAMAQEVEWTATKDYYKASFIYNNLYISAFYNAEGGLLAVTRFISSANLPLTLQSQLKKQYQEYWISELFEMSKNNGTEYYITLQNADTKLVLKSASGSDWYVYNKTKKV
jgi:hypothetical protein